MLLNKSKLIKAISAAVTTSTICLFGMSDANAASTTMYNLSSAGGIDFSGNTTACAPCNGGLDTDGWVWGYGDSGSGTPQGSTNSVAKWAGTGATYTTPFGYNGAGIVNWALHMRSNSTAEISSQDSLNRYGVAADIDATQGAWSDNALSGAVGRRHDLDYGLFKSDAGGLITLNAQGINQGPILVLQLLKAWTPAPVLMNIMDLGIVAIIAKQARQPQHPCRVAVQNLAQQTQMPSQTLLDTA